LWNREAEYLRGLEIDHELELRRLFDRKLGGLGTFEDLVRVNGSASVKIDHLWAIRHQAASLGELSTFAHQGKPICQRELDDSLALTGRPRSVDDNERIGAGLLDRR